MAARDREEDRFRLVCAVLPVVAGAQDPRIAACGLTPAQTCQVIANTAVRIADEVMAALAGGGEDHRE